MKSIREMNMEVDKLALKLVDVSLFFLFLSVLSLMIRYVVMNSV